MQRSWEIKSLLKVQIQLQDFDEQQRHLQQLAEAGGPYDALTRPHHRHYDSLDGHVSQVAGGEDKVAQTDLTYAVRNKRIQTVHIDESDSDDDPDIANQSLSRSHNLNSADAQAFGLQSFNGIGFANVAMQVGTEKRANCIFNIHVFLLRLLNRR